MWMMWIDGKTLLLLLAAVLGLPVLIGAVAGGVVGGLRGRPGTGLGWEISGGIFGGFVGELIGTTIVAALSSGPPLYIGGLLSDRGKLIFVGGIVIGAILSATMLVRRPTDPTSNEPDRHWFARHWVAMIATAIVLGVLGWKNQYREGLIPREGIVGVPPGIYEGYYGWPRLCVVRFNGDGYAL